MTFAIVQYLFHCSTIAGAGNTIPEPHTEDGLPGWAIGVLVAAIVVTVVWVILLIALVSSIMAIIDKAAAILVSYR